MGRELICKGNLQAILAMGPLTRRDYNREDEVEEATLSGFYSRLQIATRKESITLRYGGIILPDSIGNDVEVYQVEPADEKIGRKHPILHILDKKLERWYT